MTFTNPITARRRAVRHAAIRSNIIRGLLAAVALTASLALAQATFGAVDSYFTAPAPTGEWT